MQSCRVQNASAFIIKCETQNRCMLSYSGYFFAVGWENFKFIRTKALISF